MVAGEVAGGEVLDVSVPGSAPFDRVMGSDLAPFDVDGVVSCVGVWVRAAFVGGEVGEQLEDFGSGACFLLDDVPAYGFGFHELFLQGWQGVGFAVLTVFYFVFRVVRLVSSSRP